MRAEKFIDAGGDDVVVFWHEVAKGRESGVWWRPTPAPCKRFVTARSFESAPIMDRAEALEAAGLWGRPADT